MLSDGFVGQEQLFRVVFLGEYLFVGYEVMDASVTILANHEASLVHLLFAEAVLEAFFAMNPSGDQVVLCQGLLTPAQLAVPIALLLLPSFHHEHLAKGGFR